MSDKTFIEEVLKYASQEARYFTADALFCHLHNTGQMLAGNTEGSDVEWLARNLWERAALPVREGFHYEQTPPETRQKWEDIARVCLVVMPRLQQRIASRLIELSKVMQEIERAERRAYKRQNAYTVAQLREYIIDLEAENEKLKANGGQR